MKKHKRSMRSGNRKKPTNGKKLCVACQGTGESTSGSQCHPCKGTGYLFKYNMEVIR